MFEKSVTARVPFAKHETTVSVEDARAMFPERFAVPQEPAALSEIIPRVRAEPLMVDAFSAALGIERARNPSVRITRAGFLRKLIWEALSARGYAPFTERAA